MVAKDSRPVDRAFNGANVALMLLVIFLTLYPFWYVIVCSFSSIAHVIGNGFVLWPDGIHLDAYRQIFRNNLVPTGYRNTLIVTSLGTLLSMAISITGAYGLSVKKLPGHRSTTFFVVFTMLFNGGLVPTYLVVSNLKLVDKLWALILPSALNAYNVILLRNFFQSIPEELHEAASIDGISRAGYLFRIVIPLSSASIATIGMFYAVAYWNAYFNAVIYIRTASLWPMQMILRQILVTNQFNTLMYDDAAQTLASETLKNAMIVVTVLPIVCVYPFVQKYFVKGIMVGSLKG